MIYLLCARPEMLMPGTRPGLFCVAGNEIEDILSHSSEPPLDTEESLAREIISVVKSTPATTTYSVIPDACRLAEALMKLDDKERWTEHGSGGSSGHVWPLKNWSLGIRIEWVNGGR
jgi:hypothetical protein